MLPQLTDTCARRPCPTRRAVGSTAAMMRVPSPSRPLLVDYQHQVRFTSCPGSLPWRMHAPVARPGGSCPRAHSRTERGRTRERARRAARSLTRSRRTAVTESPRSASAADELAASRGGGVPVGRSSRPTSHGLVQGEVRRGREDLDAAARWHAVPALLRHRRARRRAAACAQGQDADDFAALCQTRAGAGTAWGVARNGR